MYDCTCELLTTTPAVSEIGDTIEQITSTHKVFCRVVSADYKEQEMAQSRGKNASITFILPDNRMYQDERWIGYKSHRYEVVAVKFSDLNNEIRLVGSLWENQ